MIGVPFPALHRRERESASVEWTAYFELLGEPRDFVEHIVSQGAAEPLELSNVECRTSGDAAACWVIGASPGSEADDTPMTAELFDTEMTSPSESDSTSGLGLTVTAMRAPPFFGNACDEICDPIRSMGIVQLVDRDRDALGAIRLDALPSAPNAPIPSDWPAAGSVLLPGEYGGVGALRVPDGLVPLAPIFSAVFEMHPDVHAVFAVKGDPDAVWRDVTAALAEAMSADPGHSSPEVAGAARVWTSPTYSDIGDGLRLEALMVFDDAASVGFLAVRGVASG